MNLLILIVKRFSWYQNYIFVANKPAFPSYHENDWSHSIWNTLYYDVAFKSSLFFRFNKSNHIKSHFIWSFVFWKWDAPQWALAEDSNFKQNEIATFCIFTWHFSYLMSPISDQYSRFLSIKVRWLIIFCLC